MKKKKDEPIRIIILGAGFAGIYAYLKLHKKLHTTSAKQITIVNEHDLFTFIPMIHEVATGTLLPFSITQSLRSLPQCCLERFVEGRVLQIDADAREVVVRHLNPEAPPSGKGVSTSPEEHIPFDYCISALGSDTNFFGVPGAKEHALTLESLEDARRIKNRIIESFEQAQITKSEAERKRLLRFVIVGGGPTGVELAGEMSDLINGELHKAFPSLHPVTEIRLYEGKTRYLCNIDEWFGEYAYTILASKKHVQTFCGLPVSRVTGEGFYAGEEYIPAGTVIWTAGVKARELSISAKKRIVREERTGRIKVNSYLQIPTYPFLFVAGDQAWIKSKEVGQPYPMRAQFAIQEGIVAAGNIERMIWHKPLQEFFWHDRGFIVSLGKGSALANVFGFRVLGPLAWILYRTGCLAKIVGWRAKLRTLLEWTLNTFLPRDISKL